MCGICGFINLDGKPAQQDIIVRMNHALAHRGPDDAGIFVDNTAAIAMRRLAILDIDSGHQPMSNEDYSLWIVFNGEIYNSPALTSQLHQRGHHFRTSNSDTEAIIHQYEEDGFASVHQLRGMFAFAILDFRMKAHNSSPTLFLARDRLGIKPLFFYHDHNLFAFSSELTSLVQHPAIPRDIDPTALYQYLATGVVASPLTMFKGIRQLLPGQYLVLNGNHVKFETYWQPATQSINTAISRADAITEIKYLLNESVKENMLSDVPLGAFLSGGIDSSAIVALMAKASGQQISTFSIRFEETNYDESAFARLVAKRYNTNHHEFTIPNQSFDPDLLQAMITHHGQPTADTSAIPTYLVSQLARNYVKVALSGDGGDECFAGYNHFGWAKRISNLYRYPNSIRRLMHSTLLAFSKFPGINQSTHTRQAINALESSFVEQHLLPFEILRINKHNTIQQFLTPEWLQNNANNEIFDFLYNNDNGEQIRLGQQFAFRYFLPDAYLAKVDRMSMANALEVRVPLLDHRLIEFSLSLPSTMHWQNGIGKQLLRTATADLLPTEIFTHRKQGFSIPLHRWVTPQYFDLATELLNEHSLKRRGIFIPDEVNHLLQRSKGSHSHYRSLESDYRLSHRLFMLVSLEMWFRLYIDSLIAEPTTTSRWTMNVRENSDGTHTSTDKYRNGY